MYRLFILPAILGIVEGITEFLPISSTGHLIIINEFIGFTGPFAKMFDVVIQLGAILAVVVYYHERLFAFITAPGRDEKRRSFSIWLKAAVGVLPAIVTGLLLGSRVQEYLFNPFVVAGALVLGGAILIIVERSGSGARREGIENIGYGTALAIGCIQCLAMIPGTSRSAATIIGAMLLGASRVTAAEFSFFLAIPTMVAASAYSLMKHGSSMSAAESVQLAVGFAISFVVAYVVIAAFIRFISRRDFIPFAWYRIVLGIAVLAWFIVFR